MQVISEISEPEFEFQFLSSEWYKPFYDSVRESFDELIVSANLGDWRQNYIRKELLWKWRYPLLAQLPFGIDWYSIELEPQEFEDILVIREDGWNKTFGLGKNLKEAAIAVGNNVEDKWGVNFSQIRDIKNKIGKYNFKEKIILISSSMSPPYTVVEGNHRAVAFTLKRLETGQLDHIPKQFILGVSQNMSNAYWLNLRSDNT